MLLLYNFKLLRYFKNSYELKTLPKKLFFLLSRKPVIYFLLSGSSSYQPSPNNDKPR